MCIFKVVQKFTYKHAKYTFYSLFPKIFTHSIKAVDGQKFLPKYTFFPEKIKTLEILMTTILCRIEEFNKNGRMQKEGWKKFV